MQSWVEIFVRCLTINITYGNIKVFAQIQKIFSLRTPKAIVSVGMKTVMLGEMYSKSISFVPV